VFYFEQMFQTALNGIDGANLMPTVVQVAGSILLLSFLYSMYEGFARGGDGRILLISATKYAILGLVFLNYGSVFRSVNDMFNAFANFIATASAGGGDVFDTWRAQVQTHIQANGWDALWNLVTGLIPGVVSVSLLLVGLIVFPITYTLFALLYSLYGSVLYVVGPLVLALFPALGTGPLARTYLLNLMVFHAWGVIYAIFGALMAAVNLGSLAAVLNAGDVAGAFAGSTQMTLLALTSILFSLAIALIPFLARRIVQGDAGSTMFALAGTAMVAGQVAAATFLGASLGRTQARSDAGGGSGGSQVGPRMRSGDGSNAAAHSSSRPPEPPRSGNGEPAGDIPVAAGSSSAPASQNVEPLVTRSGDGAAGATSALPEEQPGLEMRGRPGQFRGFNFPHAIAAATAYSLGRTYYAAKRLVRGRGGDE